MGRSSRQGRAARMLGRNESQDYQHAWESGFFGHTVAEATFGQGLWGFFNGTRAFLCAGRGGPTLRYPIAPASSPPQALRTPDTRTHRPLRRDGVGSIPQRSADRWGMPNGVTLGVTV